MDNKVLCCYFPTTVLMVDDSKAFLGAFSLMLDKCLSYSLNTSPHQALEFIKSTYQPYSLLEQLHRSVVDEDQKHDLLAITGLVHNPKRFETVSVVIVDYSMPEMNGLEFCQELSGLPVKKIMLTGEADLQTAVAAFNEGLIDKFFLKHTHNVYQEINTAIFALQRAYFEKLTEKMIDIMSSERFGFLCDPSYAKLFKEAYEEKWPMEYYLANTSGSYLMIDEGGKRSWLAVNTDKDMTYYRDVAIGNYAPESVIEELKNRSKIIFFQTEEHYLQASVLEWPKFMYSANTVGEGGLRYYYTTVD
ncbi:MAG: response regulator [Planctomycetes bacterium]|nr:response regulator [Planctomycetota bacterium]